MMVMCWYRARRTGRAGTHKSPARCDSILVFEFLAGGGHTNIAFFPAMLYCFFWGFERMARTHNSPSRYDSIVFFAFRAYGGHTKIAFSLRFYGVVRVSSVRRAHTNRLLAAILYCFSRFRRTSATQKSHSSPRLYSVFFRVSIVLRAHKKCILSLVL